MRRTALALLALPLAGCAATDGPAAPFARLAALFEGAAPETRPLAQPPAPAARPGDRFLTSMTMTSLVDGQERHVEIRPDPDGEGIRGRQENGCVWTRLDWFAPSDSWRDCGDSSNWRAASGRTRELDPLYPLQAGATGRYAREVVSHTGREQARVTECEVTGAEAVLREGAEPAPAWVVVCSDGKRRRTTWYSPAEGPVAYRQVHPEDGVEEAWVRRP
ncbi:MAG: hypothetical protein ACQEUZ_02720 [Pseudomonadota bacterium]